MKSAILKDGKIQITEKDKPELTHDKKGAVVKITGCGLCGSDIVKINHATKENENKIVLGHEITGIIEDINVNIIGNGEKIPFKKGDKIAMGHHYPCFKCKMCLLGHHSMCETFKSSNIYPAGFGEYIYINENHLKYTVFKKPDNLTEEEFSFLEPLSCCIRAIRRACVDFEHDNSIFNALVIGLGSIGLLTAQALKAFKVNTFGFDINYERQNFAKENFNIDFNENLKYDLIFMTSGSYKALYDVYKFAQKGAVIIVFSSISNDKDGYLNNEIYYNELTVMGSYSPSPNDLLMSKKLLETGLVKTKNFSTNYNLYEIEKAIKDTKEGKILKGYIKL